MIAGVGLVGVPSLAPILDPQVRGVQLTSTDTADSPLGDGVALIMGTSGNPMPPQIYADASVFAAELQAGDPLGAIGDPIAADLVLIPAGIVFGVANAVEAVGGTLVNLVDLIPGI